MSYGDIFRILLNRQGKNFLLCTKVTVLIFFLKEKVFSEEAGILRKTRRKML